MSALPLRYTPDTVTTLVRLYEVLLCFKEAINLLHSEYNKHACVLILCLRSWAPWCNFFLVFANSMFLGSGCSWLGDPRLLVREPFFLDFSLFLSFVKARSLPLFGFFFAFSRGWASGTICTAAGIVAPHPPSGACRVHWGPPLPHAPLRWCAELDCYTFASVTRLSLWHPLVVNVLLEFQKM